MVGGALASGLWSGVSVIDETKWLRILTLATVASTFCKCIEKS